MVMRIMEEKEAEDEDEAECLLVLAKQLMRFCGILYLRISRCRPRRCRQARKQSRARRGHGRDDAPRPLHRTWTHEGHISTPHAVYIAWSP